MRKAHNRLELKGRRFGRLLVIKHVRVKKRGSTYWKCLCDCGNFKVIKGAYLTSGNKTKSCGCLMKEVSAKNAKKLKFVNISHNMSRTYFYRVLIDINQRCNNSRNKRYKDYGGRGIKCLWNSFEEFKDDMYESYLEHKGKIEKIGIKKNTTIERINTNGDYCKENCQWATQKQQGRNRRNNHLITYKNETKSIAEWADVLNFKHSTIRNRLTRGWSTERALIPI
mgnify:FL=1